MSSQCTRGDVRLVGGSVPNEGRVEVCVNSVWGTVCDDLWDVQDAMVVCGQLGYARNGKTCMHFSFSELGLSHGAFISSGAVAYSRAHFGQGTGPIVLDDVQCNSTIHRGLLDCPHDGLHIHNCAHSEDAGISCTPCMLLLLN